MSRPCPECGKVHPEDKLVEQAELTWETIKEFTTHKDWPLASKLAALCLELGNECAHQWDRAEFFAKEVSQLPCTCGHILAYHYIVKDACIGNRNFCTCTKFVLKKEVATNSGLDEALNSGDGTYKP